MTTPEYRVDLPRMERVFVGGREETLIGRDRAAIAPDRLLLAARMSAVEVNVLHSEEYLLSVGQGIAMLRAHGIADETVLVADFADPFGFALDLPPVRGGYSWIHPGRNLTLATARDPAALFAGVAYVMVPRFPIWPPSRILAEAAWGAYIRAEYTLVEDGRFWQLYSRRPR